MIEQPLSTRLRDILGDFRTLIAAKDEKDAKGESERYHEMKRNAWGNARIAVGELERLLGEVEALEAAACPSGVDDIPPPIGKVELIKAYRARHGCSLLQAKHAVEHYLAHQPLADKCSACADAEGFCPRHSASGDDYAEEIALIKDQRDGALKDAEGEIERLRAALKKHHDLACRDHDGVTYTYSWRLRAETEEVLGFSEVVAEMRVAAGSVL